jgi:2-methylcitrate dehydratase PrpD
MDGDRLVSDFVRNLRWDNLDGAVREKVKLTLLDALGATLSGTQTRISTIAADYAPTAWPGDDASILMYNRTATPAGAAFANGCAANGFDSDDGAKYTRGHPGAQLFPATLAVSEKLGRGGQEMMTAMVVGYEVAMRTGRCWHDHHQVYEACGSWGSVATAAATAHLMGLDAPLIESALGIAEYHAPNLPMMRDIDHPTMVKHGIGWGTVTGITAAELAARGYTGIPSLLSFEKHRDWVSDIGEHYLIVDGVTFKEFASCGWGHSPICAARELVQKHAISADEIAHVRVEGFHETVRLGADPPTTTEEAQFSTGWPLAAFLVYGEVSPRQTNDNRLEDQRIRALLDRIELVENDTFTRWSDMKWKGDPEGRYASRVVITIVDGTQFDSGVYSFSHDYGAGWDADRVAEKFRWLVQDVVADDVKESLVEMALAFDKVADVKELVALVR